MKHNDLKRSNVFFVRRWAQAFSSMFGVNPSNGFRDRVNKLLSDREKRQAIVERVNEQCLANPDLFSQLLRFPEESPVDVVYGALTNVVSGLPKPIPKTDQKMKVLQELHLVGRRTTSEDKDRLEMALENLQSASFLARALLNPATTNEGTEDTKLTPGNTPGPEADG